MFIDISLTQAYLAGKMSSLMGSVAGWEAKFARSQYGGVTIAASPLNTMNEELLFFF